MPHGLVGLTGFVSGHLEQAASALYHIALLVALCVIWRVLDGIRIEISRLRQGDSTNLPPKPSKPIRPNLTRGR